MKQDTLRIATLLVVTALFACKKNNAQTEPSPAPPPQPVTTTPQQPTAFSHRASGTKLAAPVGWGQKTGGSWVAFFAPDKTAVLALDSYPRGKDPSATIMKVARELGLVDIDWKGGTKSITINGIPGKTADGNCKVGGQPALYSYATLTTGADENVLVLYAVEARAPAQRRQEAAQSLRSIQRL
jgi:hypothetical protein